MKWFNSLLILLFILACSFRSPEGKTKSLELTASFKDTDSIAEAGRVALNVLVKLRNMTADTVYYTSMTCSWPDAYKVNVDSIHVRIMLCDRNTIEVKEIAPYNYEERVLRLWVTPVTYKRLKKQKFKVGFNFLDARSHNFNTYGSFSAWSDALIQDTNIIWSNDIALP